MSASVLDLLTANELRAVVVEEQRMRAALEAENKALRMRHEILTRLEALCPDDEVLEAKLVTASHEAARQVAESEGGKP